MNKAQPFKVEGSKACPELVDGSKVEELLCKKETKNLKVKNKKPQMHR